MSIVFLKKNEDFRILKGHLWIYSNEIDTDKSPLKIFVPGEIVEIRSSKNIFLGKGYINPHTLLCIRILTLNFDEKIDINFFIRKITQALIRREKYFKKPFYRLVFGESDFLPGVVIDRFSENFVIQINTYGMEHLKSLIIDAIKKIFNPKFILLKNDTSFRLTEGLENYVEIAYGTNSNYIMLNENDIDFVLSINEGQKTGWYFDQSINRNKLINYIKNKTVLDLFSYSGGFGITSAVYGAKNVICVDSSNFALELLEKSAIKNKINNKITTLNYNIFDLLEIFNTKKEYFDIVILDPPALIKKQKDFKLGFNAYLKLHKIALSLLSSGGILLTTSCSHHLSKQMLLEILKISIIKEKRQILILEELSQSPDHVIHPIIEETSYLKGFIVEVI